MNVNDNLQNGGPTPIPKFRTFGGDESMSYSDWEKWKRDAKNRCKSKYGDDFGLSKAFIKVHLLGLPQERFNKVGDDIRDLDNLLQAMEEAMFGKPNFFRIRREF
jgi:hypothetical protein